MDDSTISEIFDIPIVSEHNIVEYYPHIIQQYNHGGMFKDEKFELVNNENYSVKTDIFTEYIHREKKLVVHESGDREYLLIKQLACKLSNGLDIVSDVECIDPNKFPVLNKYYDICKKNVVSYEDNYITISSISEKNNNYIKLSFQIPKKFDEQYKRRVLRHFKAALSLLPQN